jgi:hypothetical protein
MSKKHTSPNYERMTLAELREATKEYDAEDLSPPKSKPVPPALKAVERRIRKNLGGRPKVGQGAKRVLITVEQGLLKQADKVAKARNLSRSELIALGLRLAMKRSA